MEKMQHFSIRKLSIGVASVLIGISFLGVKASTVKADSLQNTSATELAKPKAANSIIKQDPSSNIEQEPVSKTDTKQITNDQLNTVQEPVSKTDTKQITNNQLNTVQEPVSKVDTKQITNDQPNTDQTPAKPASPKPNSNQQNTADLETKPQVPDKAKLQTNSVITPDKTGQTKVETTSLLATTNKKLNANLLSESKIMSPTNDTNGGFDSSWGKLNVNDWKGNIQGDYYQLTSYTGDANHIIVPNEADFAKAGISTSGKQVGVTSDFMHTIFRDKTTAQDATVAFSKTDNKQVKAIDADWSNTWGHDSEYINGSPIRSEGYLTKFDGTNLDVSSVTNMSYMFESNQISDLSSLSNWDVSHVTDMHSMFREMITNNFSALSNWNVSNVTDMSEMFNLAGIHDLSPFASWNVSKVTNMDSMFSLGYISDLSPLANWDVSRVTNMNAMFSYCQQISDLSPLTNWKVDKVTSMGQMFAQSQISDLSPLSNWKVDNVRDMSGMFMSNQISNLKPLTNWNVAKVTDMSDMFDTNQIGDLSPISGWKVDNVTEMSGMFDDNSGSKTKIATAKRIIDFVYPAGYTGKKQDSVTQTVDVPQKVSVTLTTKESKPSNNILDWVTTAEAPEPEDTAPVYFQDYTVPEIKGLLEPDKTVISGQQADITKPINVTVTYKLVDSNTNDAFALDSKNGLHEHANVNDNGGYDEDFWGKINIDDWNYTVSGDRIEINGLKDSASTGTNDAVIVPNLDDFKLAGKDGGAKTVYISGYTLGKTAKHKYYGLSKTNDNKFVTDSDLSLLFYKNSNLTHADLNSLNTSNITNMTYMFSNAKSLTDLDVSNWNTSNVTNMVGMFINASSLTNLDMSKWNTSNVTNMGRMFIGASSLTNLDVSHWDTSKVTDMHAMFYNASSLTSLDVSNWNTSNVTNMGRMFDGTHSLTNLNVSNWNTGSVTNMSSMFDYDHKLALIVNGDKFADYLVKNNFAYSGINSSVKSVTTDNTKLLKLLTNDVQHKSANRTIVLMFPVSYNPDLVKYHLIKVGNTYQIKQFADYDKPYLQGTVLINATNNIDDHHIDTTKPNKLVNTWQPNYNKLILAHKNNDGTVSFDAVQLPKVPGYKAVIRYESPKVAEAINPRAMLFGVSYIAIPKKLIEPDAKPIEPNAKPDKSTAKLDKPTTKPNEPATKFDKPDVTPSKPDVQDHLSDRNMQTPVAVADDAVVSQNVDSVDFDWKIATKMGFDNGKRQAVAFEVSNSDYSLNLPYVSNSKLHLIKQYTTKDAVSFAYVGQNSEYVFNIKFVNEHYLLTTYKIKSGKLVKLTDYNFVKSSKMIEVILDWLQLK